MSHALVFYAQLCRIIIYSGNQNMPKWIVYVKLRKISSKDLIY